MTPFSTTANLAWVLYFSRHPDCAACCGWGRVVQGWMRVLEPERCVCFATRLRCATLMQHVLEGRICNEPRYREEGTCPNQFTQENLEHVAQGIAVHGVDCNEVARGTICAGQRQSPADVHVCVVHHHSWSQVRTEWAVPWPPSAVQHPVRTLPAHLAGFRASMYVLGRGLPRLPTQLYERCLLIVSGLGQM
jgi:hypothetical protein